MTFLHVSFRVRMGVAEGLIDPDEIVGGTRPVGGRTGHLTSHTV